jgi:hypothetical protein
MRRGVIGWLILVIGLLGLNERFFVAWAQGSKSKKAKKGETPTFAMLNASPGEFINKKMTLVGYQTAFIYPVMFRVLFMLEKG